MRSIRVPLSVLLLSAWALLVALDGQQGDVVDVLLLVPAAALAVWAMADSLGQGTNTTR